MAWFLPRFYSLLLLCVRLLPFALQDSLECVAGAAAFSNHMGKS